MNRKDVATKAALVVVMAGMATGGAYASEKLFDLAHETDQQAAQITQLSHNLDASRQQLKVHGITPVVPSSREVLTGTPAAHPAPSPTAAPSLKVESVTDHHGGQPVPVKQTVLLYAATDPRRKM